MFFYLVICIIHLFTISFLSNTFTPFLILVYCLNKYAILVVMVVRNTSNQWVMIIFIILYFPFFG